MVGDDIKDIFLSVVLSIDRKFKLSLTSLSRVSLIGPLGLGNGIESHSSKRILIAAKDDGILPFTDMLEFFA